MALLKHHVAKTKSMRTRARTVLAVENRRLMMAMVVAGWLVEGEEAASVAKTTTAE